MDAVLVAVLTAGIVFAAAGLIDCLSDYRCVRCKRACRGRVAGGTIDAPVCVTCFEREREDPATRVNHLPDARKAFGCWW